MRNYYVYILTNKNNTTLYVGVTNNIYRRIAEHRSEKIEGFTKKYNLKKLVFMQEFKYLSEAIAGEKIIKGWTRKKKNELINANNPDWKDLLPAKFSTMDPS